MNGLLARVAHLVKQYLPQGAPMFVPGDVAPDFNLMDHRGNPVCLRDFAGRNLVLWFYPEADTPG